MTMIGGLTSAKRSTKTKRKRSYAYYLPLIAIILIAFFLRLIFLEEFLLNPDERRVISWYRDVSLEEITLEYQTGDQIFHSILLRLAAEISATPFFLRFTTATVFGILTIPIFYQLVRRLIDRRAALISILFLAVSTHQIYYAKDIRGYALIVLLSTASTLFLYQALVNNKLRWWLLFIFASVLNMYTHLFTAGMIAAHVVMIAWYWWCYRRTTSFRVIRNAVLSLGAIGGLLIIFYGPLTLQILNYPDEEKIAGSDFARISEIPVYQQIIEHAAAFGRYLTYEKSSYSVLFFLMVVFVGFAVMVKKQSFQAGWFGIWLILPYLLAIIAFNASPLVFLKQRFLQYVIPPTLVLLAYGAIVIGDYFRNLLLKYHYPPSAQLNLVSWLPAAIICAVFVYLNSVTLADSISISTANNWDKASQYLLENVSSNSLILCEEYNSSSWVLVNDDSNSECLGNLSLRTKVRGTYYPFLQTTQLRDWDKQLAKSPLLTQPVQIWLIRWNMPVDAPTTYDPAWSVNNGKRIDIIKINEGQTLIEGILKLAEIRTHFQEDALNQAIHWAQLARIQLLLDQYSFAQTSIERAASYQIEDQLFQAYLSELESEYNQLTEAEQ